PLGVTENGSTFPLASLPPTLVPGETYLLVVFRDTTDRFRFVTLPARFTAISGRSGLRVFNATGFVGGLDVTAAAVGSALGPPTFTDVLGNSTSAFVDVPAGSLHIRITRHGSSATLLDIPTQELQAGQRVTLLLLPPARGLPTPVSFVVPAC